MTLRTAGVKERRGESSLNSSTQLRDVKLRVEEISQGAGSRGGGKPVYACTCAYVQEYGSSMVEKMLLL